MKKFGLWEEGKRIHWFDEDQVTQINNRSLNYNTFFKNPRSKEGLNPKVFFEKPVNFD